MLKESVIRTLEILYPEYRIEVRVWDMDKHEYRFLFHSRKEDNVHYGYEISGIKFTLETELMRQVCSMTRNNIGNPLDF